MGICTAVPLLFDLSLLFCPRMEIKYLLYLPMMVFLLTLLSVW